MDGINPTRTYFLKQWIESRAVAYQQFSKLAKSCLQPEHVI